jgi:hypothetical protein
LCFLSGYFICFLSHTKYLAEEERNNEAICYTIFYISEKKVCEKKICNILFWALNLNWIIITEDIQFFLSWSWNKTPATFACKWSVNSIWDSTRIFCYSIMTGGGFYIGTITRIFSLFGRFIGKFYEC